MLSEAPTENVVGRILTPTINDNCVPSSVLVHIAQLQPTDRPIEDRFSVDYDSDQGRLLVGVYDGHGGPETAEHISKVLPRKLLMHSSSCLAQQFVELDDSILSAFKRDHSMFRRKSNDWFHNAQLIKSGSTALVFDIDLNKSIGHFANAGDCRLVICGADTPMRQTQDLNAKTLSERERLSMEHPNEDQLIVGDRLFGRLMATRGFGDGYYKLPKGTFGDGQHRKFIQTISSVERPGKIPMIDQYASIFYGYKTPPYLTANPDTGDYELEEGDFVILASDGLWDLVSSQEASEIVLEGASAKKDNLAEYLLEKVKSTRPPGDDITIIVLRI